MMEMKIRVRCFEARALALFFLMILAIAGSPRAEAPGDEFLRGYIASILEQELHWKRDGYRVVVFDGTAAVTMLKNDPEARQAALEKLGAVEELKGVSVSVNAREEKDLDMKGRIAATLAEGEKLPSGDLFRPLIADPKQPQFFVSLDRFRSPGEKYTMGEAGFGETFGIYRAPSLRKGECLQLSVEASLVARFNMDAYSHDLLNADYSVGFPLTYRSGNNSFRARIYHQSSHLGDEFLLDDPDAPKRINLSFEAFEFIYSRQWKGFRGYIGGEYMIRREPGDLERASAHFGFDYIGSRKFFKTGRFIGGADFKSYQEQSWNIDSSVKFGFLFGPPETGHRRLRLMAEWYRGHDPRGQFFINRVDYFGLNLSLGF